MGLFFYPLYRFKEERKMNNIEKVLKEFEGKRVWFYLKDDVQARFKDELLKLHGRWLDGSLLTKQHHLSHFIAVHEDYCIAFISAYIWAHPLSKQDNKIIKIDYQKLMNHQNDYQIINDQSKYIILNE